MQTTLETLDQLTRRLNVAVPIAQIESEVQKRLARLAKTAKIAGFRPGKVPLKMVAQQYGQQVRSDVISDAVNESFSDAVRAQNLRVAGYPSPTTLNDGEDGLFTKPAIADYPPYLHFCNVPTPATSCNTDEYKSATRQYIESLGYDIVANFGDQFSDLEGGFADRTSRCRTRTTSFPERRATRVRCARGRGASPSKVARRRRGG